MSGSLAVPGGVAPRDLRDLFSELGDLKRTRSASRLGSVAERGFRAAWVSLLAGDAVETVMRSSVADALAAARLGDLDAATLEDLGLDPTAALDVLRHAFDVVTVGIDTLLAARLRPALGSGERQGPTLPFVDALARQPRAGVTCPGKPRLLLEPPENHAEHCWAVAILGVLLAPRYDADPRVVFLAGLSHHLHNASMPDSGFTGEMLLGDHLDAVCATATKRALDELPASLRETVLAARSILPDATTPEGRAFHAADVIDRVMQTAQHLRVASVTLPMLLDDWALVHDGPVKGFHDGVLAEMDLP